MITTLVVPVPPSYPHAWPMRIEVDMYLSEVVISLVYSMVSNGECECASVGDDWARAHASA